MSIADTLFSLPDPQAEDRRVPGTGRSIEAKPLPPRRERRDGASPRPPHAPRPSAGLSRGQTIDRIIVINPTATTAFLDQFEDRELSSYLDHLTASQTPRGRDAVWCRPEGVPAIVTRRPAA